MSRIGKKPITIPAGVTINVDENNKVTVEGPKGKLVKQMPAGIDINVGETEINVSRPNDLKKMRAYHGLTRTLIDNMIIGVTAGFEKKLEINGVGYRAQKKDKTLVMNLGYSNPVEMIDPEGLEVVVEGQNVLFC